MTQHPVHAIPTQPTLLLVDDDRLILSFTSESLQEGGFNVVCAESAEEAQDLLASGVRPELAIVDVSMPGLGGLWLARRLAELDHVPFVMLSAHSDEVTLREASQLGALGYLVKPLDCAQLLPTITAALARAKELVSLRMARNQLQTELAQERDISVAAGITMVQVRVTRCAAFEILRKSARNHGRRLAAVASDVVAQCEALQAAPGPSGPGKPT